MSQENHTVDVYSMVIWFLSWVVSSKVHYSILYNLHICYGIFYVSHNKVNMKPLTDFYKAVSPNCIYQWSQLYKH